MNLRLIILLNSTNPEEEFIQNLLVAFCFFLPFIIGFIYFLYLSYYKKKYRKIIFNQRLPYNNDNLLEAYILLSAHILKSDRGYSKEKLQFIYRYFMKHFPKSYYNFKETLSDAYKNPIMINSVTSWVRAFMRSKTDRTQIIYFLAGICIIDGRFSRLEVERLEEIALKIRLTQKEFDSIIAMYKSNNKAYQEENKNKKKQYRSASSNSSRSSGSSRKTYSSPPRRESKKNIQCKILEVSPSASMAEVKKAYRKLVKIHHPDRFHNASEEQKNIAKEKFITIQKAYEYLEMIMK